MEAAICGYACACVGAVVEKTISGDARVGNDTDQIFEHFTSLAESLSKVSPSLAL
jgi:hypothetical protein